MNLAYPGVKPHVGVFNRPHAGVLPRWKQHQAVCCLRKLKISATSRCLPECQAFMQMR